MNSFFNILLFLSFFCAIVTDGFPVNCQCPSDEAQEKRMIKFQNFVLVFLVLFGTFLFVALAIKICTRKTSQEEEERQTR